MFKSVREFVLSQRRTIGLRLTRAAAFAILCSLTSNTFAGRPGSSQEPKFEMGTFYLCLLVKGPKFNPAETPQSASWGPGHTKQVLGLIESGRVVISGPFIDRRDRSAEDSRGSAILCESSI